MEIKLNIFKTQEKRKNTDFHEQPKQKTKTCGEKTTVEKLYFLVFSTTVFFLSAFSLSMIFTQIILGALNPWTKFDVWIRVAHLGASSLLWGSVALLFSVISFKIFRSSH